MKKLRILTIFATLSILLSSVIACGKSADPPITEPEESADTIDTTDAPGTSAAPGTQGGTESPSHTLPAKQKTPTPQAEYDPENYPDQPDIPNIPDKNPWDEAPLYDVDEVLDPALDGYTELSALFGALHAASEGVAPGEQAINLFDGYESSKFCVFAGKPVEVIWSMDREVPVSAYALVTGNDTAEFPDRNPLSWELYGSSDGFEGSWKLIDAVKNPDLPAANYTYKGFILKKTVRYQYFRIVFASGDEQTYIQLSELRLYTDDRSEAGFADADAPSGTVSLFDKIDRSTIKGPAGAGSHTVDCLFDNLARSGANGSNKYCVGGSDITVQWQMKEAVVITDYVVYTANDTESYPDRNPIRWTLYGSTDGKDYEVVHDVKNSGLPVTNYTPTAYSTGCTTAYTYYRLEMHTVAGAGTLQLSEISLYTR